MQQLAQYLPDNTFEDVVGYLNHYKVHLTITKSRSSILGNYKHNINTKHHRISVNGNLNKYAFLITLLHELAHLVTFENFGSRVQSHGKEWKHIYGQILAVFVDKKVFPTDIENEILRTLHNPGASTCSEESLQRVLYQYDTRKANHHLLEQLPEGSYFKIKDGRVFKKGKKRTKRFICEEISSSKAYLFSPVHEVQVLN